MVTENRQNLLSTRIYFLKFNFIKLYAKLAKLNRYSPYDWLNVQVHVDNYTSDVKSNEFCSKNK